MTGIGFLKMDLQVFRFEMLVEALQHEMSSQNVFAKHF